MDDINEKQQEKLKKAVALNYDPSLDDAPKVVASGKGEVAEKIIDAASKNRVPLYKEPAVAEALSSIAPGSEIPVELYEAVAEILVFVAQMDDDYRDSKKLMY